MADMMWAGRFSKQVDAGVNAFNSSIAFDGRMYRHDIQGSIAHATMLGDCGIITKEDSLEIIEGLKGILADIPLIGYCYVVCNRTFRKCSFTNISMVGDCYVVQSRTTIEG